MATTSRDAGAELLTFAYDTAGKVTITDAASGVGNLFFDDRALLVKVDDPLGRATHKVFDNESNLIGITVM